MKMHNRLTNFFLLIICFLLGSSTCKQSSVIKIKVIPFTIHSKVNISEEDFDSLSSIKRVMQVRYDSIVNPNDVEDILSGLLLLKKQSAQPKKDYDLRMRLDIQDGLEKKCIYITRNKEIIIGDYLYEDKGSFTKLVMSKMCRPCFADSLFAESKFWVSESKPCFDTSEYKSNFPPIGK